MSSRLRNSGSGPYTPLSYLKVNFSRSTRTPSFGSKRGKAGAVSDNATLQLPLGFDLRFSPLLQHPQSETALCNGVIMAGIARPASNKTQRRIAGIYHAVRNSPRDIVQAAWFHLFVASVTTLIAQDQYSGSNHGSVKLGAIDHSVSMARRHEIFSADAARRNICRAPQNSALR